MLQLRNFRGIFMRDTLPEKVIGKQECGILNLDSIKGLGTHWCCWLKISDKLCYYFDSFGLYLLLENLKYISSVIFFIQLIRFKIQMI
jgi:hypothetical protein